MKADIVLKKELLKGNPGGYYVPGVDDGYNLSFTPTKDDMPDVDRVNLQGMLRETAEYKSILNDEARRESMERTRINNEYTRTKSENERNNAETSRAAAEEERAQAEQERITEHNTAMDNVAAAVAEAEATEAELNAMIGNLIKIPNTLITKDNYTSYFTDYNDIPVNTVYNIASNVSLLNSPPGNTTQNQVDTQLEYMAGTVITLSGNGNQDAVRARFQIFITTSNRISQSVMCFRNAYTSGGVLYWSPWQKYSETMALTAANIVIRAATADRFFTDLNDAPINSIYQIDLDCVEGVLKNHPNPGQSSVLITLGYSHVSRHGMVQILVGIGGDTKLFYRYGYINGYINDVADYKWTAWKRTATTTDIENLQTQINKIETNTMPIINQVNGDMVTITDAAARPAVGLETMIEPVQEGEGEPSTNNIRPIIKRNTVSVTNDTSGKTITAALPESFAGGKINLISGEGKAVYIRRVFDGSETWVKAGGTANENKYYVTIAYDTHRFAPKSGMCSHYPNTTIASGNTTIGYHAANSSSGESKLIIRPDMTVLPTVETWKNYLAQQYAAGTPVTVVYQLADADTFHVEPQQFDMLKGTNNVWSDCGSTDITYIADTKLYIDNKFNELQNAIISLGSNV